MNITDILIIVFILLGAVVGFKRGFTSSLVNFIGVILVAVIAYFLKNPVGDFLMSFCPFFAFGGIIKGVTVLNIAVYQIIAFILVFSILMIGLKVLLMATGILETILKFTIVLGIPSKILGAIVGLIENYIIVFFVLYLLSMPNFLEVGFIKESKYREPILKNTPILSGVAESTLEVLDEFKGLTDKYEQSENSNEFNLETLDLFLKYRVVTVDTVKNLVESGKIKIEGIDAILDKYEEEWLWK